MMLAAVLLAMAGQAAAQDVHQARVDLGEPAQGYAFYNRPGATVAEHNAELARCAADTWFGEDGQEFRRMGLAYELFWGGTARAVPVVKTENCMIARGWRVFELESAEGAAVAGLSGAALAERAGPWLGAETPPGRLVRSFTNQLARPNGYGTASRPRPASPGHISLKIFMEGDASVELPLLDLRAVFKQPRAKTLRWPQLPEPAPGNAIVIMRLSGTHYALAFEQDVEDSAPLGQSFGAMPSRNGRWVAVEVPAGRWRIARIQSLNLCFGSPAFEVAAGEVVYAGHFDTAGARLGPDLDLAPVRAAVQGPVVERLRPAVYRNGSTGDCNMPNIGYALEFPGAEFEPGYRGGSVAAAPAP
ncbi:hypothetical protein [Brevundimonas lenta]|uniref:Uncharacterized protein n=1 Tax=Brevundimonas lenta TaxID=424796 RepID=A0A7W6JHP9_9CAUL|nr:hypothetical protein [Brevundimonas lenta]MBB4084331.1 hypothetical protein [Brevundimonas lenta]